MKFGFFRKNFKENKYLILALSLVVIFLAVNIITLDHYGETIDEVYSVMRGEGTSRYIFRFLKTGNLDFEIWNKQIQSHPPFFATVNYWFSILGEKNFGLDYLDSHHLLIVIIYSMGLIFVFLLAKSMFGEKIGFYSLIFMMFYPRLIAHSHYSQKDVPTMVFLLMGLFFLYLAFKKKSKYLSVLAGIFAGMSITSKLSGIFIVPIFFLSCIFYWIFQLIFFKKKKGKKRITFKEDLKILIIFLVFVVISVFLFWPYLWGDPLFIVKSLKHFSGEFAFTKTLYFGEIYSARNVPWHYIPFSLFIMTPVIVLILFLLGLYTLIKNKIKERKAFEFFLLFFWITIPLIIFLSVLKLRYDMDRHLFIIVPSLVIIAGVGLDYFFSKIKVYFPRYGKKIIFVIFFIIIAFFSKEIITIHPFEGSYVNEVVRLLIPKHLEREFFLAHRGSVYRQGVEWINKNAEPNSQICFAGGHVVWHLPKRKDLISKCDDNNDYYLMVPYYSPSYDYPIVHKILIYDNSVLLYIYKVK